MKEKVNQMLKDKLFLVMLVLGLLTMVAAAGIMTVQKLCLLIILFLVFSTVKWLFYHIR